MRRGGGGGNAWPIPCVAREGHLGRRRRRRDYWHGRLTDFNGIELFCILAHQSQIIGGEISRPQTAAAILITPKAAGGGVILISLPLIIKAATVMAAFLLQKFYNRDIITLHPFTVIIGRN